MATSYQTVISCPVSQVVTDMLTEIRVARAGDVVAPELAALGLSYLNQLIDHYNANARARNLADVLTHFTPTLNTNPQTIGLAANGALWDTTPFPRPDRIIRANVIINTSNPAVRYPLTIRDAEWWALQSVQALTTAWPTDLYYRPTWNDGTNGAGGVGAVFLWPQPSSTYPIEIETDTYHMVFAAADTLWLPFGWRRMLRLRGACELARPAGQSVTPDLRQDADEAEGVVFGGHDPVPNLVTADAGMPNNSNYSGRFNFRTGLIVR